MNFGFFGQHRWGVHRTSHLRPLLVHEIMLDTYKPPPIVTARVIHYEWVAGAITYQGGVLEGHIKAPPQVNPEIIPG